MSQSILSSRAGAGKFGRPFVISNICARLLVRFFIFLVLTKREKRILHETLEFTLCSSATAQGRQKKHGFKTTNDTEQKRRNVYIWDTWLGSKQPETSLRGQSSLWDTKTVSLNSTYASAWNSTTYNTTGYSRSSRLPTSVARSPHVLNGCGFRASSAFSQTASQSSQVHVLPDTVALQPYMESLKGRYSLRPTKIASLSTGS